MASGSCCREYKKAVACERFLYLDHIWITGLLKHRGPMEAAYRAHLLHELALSQSEAEGGFSPVLIKCFNTIGPIWAVAGYSFVA